MDGFGSRWTLGDLSGAVHPTADRPTVVPNDGEPRAWAVTGRGRARPATPPVSHRARGPDNAVRCCARANDVRANVYAAPTSRCAMGSSAGDERAPRSRSARARRCPHRAAREWKGQEGAGAQMAEGGQAAQEELSHAAQLDVRKNVRGPKLLRNPFHCQKGPKVILVTRLAPPHKAGSRPGRLPTRKTRRTSFPRRHKHLPQSWGADKSRRPNSGDSGISPCSATLFGPSKRRGAARA